MSERPDTAKDIKLLKSEKVAEVQERTRVNAQLYRDLAHRVEGLRGRR